MYVCLCRAVTDSAIREAVDEGVSTYRELSLKTGCGTQCGSCVKFARSVLKETLHSRRIESPQPIPVLQVCSAA